MGFVFWYLVIIYGNYGSLGSG